MEISLRNFLLLQLLLNQLRQLLLCIGNVNVAIQDSQTSMSAVISAWVQQVFFARSAIFIAAMIAADVNARLPARSGGGSGGGGRAKGGGRESRCALRVRQPSLIRVILFAIRGQMSAKLISITETRAVRTRATSGS